MEQGQYLSEHHGPGEEVRRGVRHSELDPKVAGRPALFQSVRIQARMSDKGVETTPVRARPA